MKKLSELYANAPDEIVIKKIKTDPKQVKEGDLFVDFGQEENKVHEAIKNQAAAILTNNKNMQSPVPVFTVEDPKKELPFLCSKFYDYPEQTLKMIGVFGNDGKQVVSNIIQQLLGSSLCGYMGKHIVSCANFQKEEENIFEYSNFYSYLKDFILSDCKYVTMRLTKPIDPILLDISICTNANDNSMKNYFPYLEKTKKEGYCILNREDPNYIELANHCHGQIWTYGKENSTLQIIDSKLSLKNTQLTLKYQEQTYKVISPLLGYENIHNLCIAILTGIALGISMDVLLKKVPKLKSIGHLEVLNTETPYQIVLDSLHTKEALSQLLKYMKLFNKNRILVVMGCKGEENKEERSKLGDLLLDEANYVIFTEDNPKDEDSNQIIEEMISQKKESKHNYEIILNRKEAICKIILMANPDDIVLILGKGREMYQEKNGERYYFNDQEEIYHAIFLKEEGENIS